VFILETRLNAQSTEFASNRDWMLQLVTELEERQAQARRGGGERSIQRFRSRGKLLPRERLELLLDPGTPFMELSPLAAYGMYNDECPGASQITGIGVVSGVECMIFVNDATIKGGAVYPITLDKSLRAQHIAEENRLPCVTMVESAGANLLYAAEIFADVGGKVFANQARMSAQGIPLNKGDALLKLEAMKMEHIIRTAADGVVEAIYFASGETVAADTLLVQLKEVD